MYRVPAEILNEIVATQPLKTEWCRRLFSRTPENLIPDLEAQCQALEDSGVPLQVALAYQEIGPLLVENEAISRFIQKKADPGLRAILPEVATLREALLLAEQDRPMSYSNRKMLATLLRELLPA